MNNRKLVIRQPALNFAHGNQPCYMSIVKPLIAADGNLYGCCEVLQYLGFTNETTLGHYSSLPSIVENQLFFNGSKCDICNFAEYNRYLPLLKSVKHLNFL